MASMQRTAVTIKNDTVNITATDDGIQVEDETDVNSGDLTITDSTVTINATDKVSRLQMN